MKNYIPKYPLISFFIIALLFSWVSVIPKILIPELPVEPFLILGAFTGPTLSVLIVIGQTEERVGLGIFFRRYVQWRAGILWWLIVLFGILIALNITASLFLGGTILKEFFSNIGLILPTYMSTLIFGAILGPLWEEAGWRRFALPRLKERYDPITGSVILGVIWAIWHIPGYPGGWMESTFPALLVYCVGFSIIATWVYNNTGGSILLMILLHSSSNAAVSVGTMVIPTNLPDAMQAFVFSGWIPAIMSGLAASLILIGTKAQFTYPQIGKWQTQGGM